MTDNPNSAAEEPVRAAADGSATQQRISMVRRRLVRIQMVIGGFAVLLVVAALVIGIFGIGDFAHGTLQR